MVGSTGTLWLIAVLQLVLGVTSKFVELPNTTESLIFNKEQETSTENYETTPLLLDKNKHLNSSILNNVSPKDDDIYLPNSSTTTPSSAQRIENRDNEDLGSGYSEHELWPDMKSNIEDGVEIHSMNSLESFLADEGWREDVVDNNTRDAISSEFLVDSSKIQSKAVENEDIFDTSTITNIESEIATSVETGGHSNNNTFETEVDDSVVMVNNIPTHEGSTEESVNISSSSDFTTIPPASEDESTTLRDAVTVVETTNSPAVLVTESSEDNGENSTNIKTDRSEEDGNISLKYTEYTTEGNMIMDDNEMLMDAPSDTMLADHPRRKVKRPGGGLAKHGYHFRRSGSSVKYHITVDDLGDSVLEGDGGIMSVNDDDEGYQSDAPADPEGVTGVSLAFVFDSTGSMHDDLQQVMNGTQAILKTMLDAQERPIYNYVLVPFHDPKVGPVTVTTNHTRFNNSLKAITVMTGGDCPEMSIGGIKLALENSLPSSYIYVFTDASAKDFKLLPQVLALIQRKKSQVVFVLTGDCGDRGHVGYQVYEKIAATSSGQVFHLNKTDVEEVLKFVRLSLQSRKVNLLSVNKPGPSREEHSVYVDRSLQEFTVSVSGRNPVIDVEDPKGHIVDKPPRLDSILTLENVRVVKVKQPDPGEWKVTTGSDSEHTVRSTGRSFMNFRYGFSAVPTKDMHETYHRPLESAMNHVLIQATEFVDLHNLTTLRLVDLKGTSLQEIDLTPVADLHGPYQGVPFLPPPGFFHLEVIGNSKDGYPVKRITATAISAQKPAVPIVTLKSKTLVPVGQPAGQPAAIKCYVESLVPFSVMWMKNGIPEQPPSSHEQTADVFLNLTNPDEAVEGTYVCRATNVAGTSTKETKLTVTGPAPNVTVPELVSATPGHATVLDCSVQSPLKYNVSWARIPGNYPKFREGDLHSIKNNSRTLTLASGSLSIDLVRPDDEGWYMCLAENIGGKSNSKVYLKVREPVKVTVYPVSLEFQQGESFSISCSASGIPEPTLVWKRNDQIIQDDDDRISLINRDFALELVIEDIDESDQGSYQCEAQNDVDKDVGQSQTRYVELPTATVVQGQVSALVGNPVTLQCQVTGIPTPTLHWTRDEQHIYPDDKYEILSDGSLRILAVSLEDAGEFTCVATSRLGTSDDFMTLDVGSMPHMVQPPSDTAIDIEQNGTLPCIVVGSPPPQISWHRKDGTPLNKTRFIKSDSGNLHITGITLEDAGTYVCVAENGFGKTEREANLKVTGIVKPVLNRIDRDSTVTLGTSTELQCRVLLGHPVPVVTWYKDGERLDEEEFEGDGLVLHSNSSLSIPYVTHEHEGTYECVATNIGGSVSRNTVLHVVESPRFSAGVPSEIRARAGEEIKLLCDVQGEPKPLVTWEKDGMLLTPTFTITKEEDDSLMIKKANVGDSGTYVCTAVNSAGTGRKAMALFVQVPPKIGPGAEAVKAIEGQIVTLTCEVTAEPAAQIEWLRDGEPLANSHQVVLYLHRNTSIRFVARSIDSATYKCMASNEAGSDSREIEVTVNVPPNIYPPYEEFLKANLGEKVTLDCYVSGSPLPDLIWQKDGEDIENDISFTISDQGTLTILNIQPDLGGMYVCDAENDVGITQKVFYLTVKVPPIIVEDLPKHVNLMKGEDYSIPCLARGDPDPDVYWRKDGQDISPFETEDATVHEDGTLSIHSASQRHSGMYTCVAKNPYGEDVKNYILEVLVPPSMIEPEVSQLEVSEGEMVVIACPAMDAIPPPQVEWLKDDKHINPSDERLTLQDRGRALQLENATVSDGGTYTCVATNLAGRTSAPFTLDVLTLPNFNDSNIEHEQVAIAGSTLTLRCSVEGNPEPKVSWKKNSHPITPHTAPGAVLSLDKQTLQIPNARPHDSGMYQCSAVNKLGSSDQDFQVEILVPPELDGPEKESPEIIKGDSMLLQCPISGLPEPHIRWSKDGAESSIAERDNLIISQDTKILEISNVRPHDSGIYVCEGTNDAGTKQKHFNVSVLEPPSISEGKFVEESKVKEGNSATLLCKVRGQPLPEVTWLHNGHIIQQDVSQSREHVLHLNNVKVTHGGKYTCMAANTIGVAEKNYRVKILVAPKLMEHFEDSNTIQSVAGLPVTIRCPVVGSPMPDIHWMKDSVPLRDGEMVHISQSQTEHAGNYTCVAQNHAGNVSKSFQLDVYVPPSINASEEQTRQLVQAKETLTLHCNVSGYPYPEIMWLKGAVPITPASWPHATFSDHNRTLVIPNVSMKNSGQYSCLAVNKAGTTELNINVEVQEPPDMADESPAESIQSVKLHRRLVLRCPMQGSPQPVITWYKDGAPVKDDAGSVHVSSDSRQLHLMHAVTQDAGRYSCLAENPAGSKQLTFQVNVDVPAVWSTWSPWSDCSTTCGPGEQIRIRECGDPELGSVDRSDCQGDAENWQHCNMAQCQVHGGWSEWSKWTSCSESCGRATRRRYRKCDNPIPAYGGQPCLGTDGQQEYCHQSPCPINGDWSVWSEWTPCSVTCDNGVKHHTRVCNNPPPAYGGKNCTGEPLEVVNCNSHHCPEDGRWSKWSQWTPCSATCGPGNKQRTRECNKPPPRYGGAQCAGENLQIVKCTLRSCDNIPIVAALRVRGKLNGENLTDNVIAASISDHGHKRTIEASINDLLKEQRGWFPYLTFMLSPVSWNTALEEDQANNGYSLTQGHFRQESLVEFSSGEELVLKHTGHGLDDNGTLWVDIEVRGEVPIIQPEASVLISPYEEDYVQTSPNTLYASSANILKVDGVKLPYSWNNTVFYDTDLGTMPFLVEKLSTEDIGTQYNPSSQEMTYMMSTAISKKYRNNMCPEGFTLDEKHMHCRDINECSDRRTNRCHVTQVCENLFGTYRCYCRPGYRSAAIGKRCTDVNECLQVPQVCSHRCRNVKGSFKCLCRPGFTLMEDGRTCIELQQYMDYPDSSWADSYYNYHEPLTTRQGGGKRMQKKILAFRAAEEKWTCPSGFEVVGGVCQDVDECQALRSVCSEEQTCLNVKGSFRCLETPCPAGYERDPDSGYCLLYCDEPGASCDSGAQLTQTVSYMVLTPDSNSVQPYQDLMLLFVNNDDGRQMPHTRYRIVENETGKPFRVRFENSQGVLYSLKPLSPGRIYRVEVLALSYDASETNVLYTTKFVIFIHLPDE